MKPDFQQQIQELQSERERLLERCVENEKHYRRLVETAKVIAWEADISTGQFTYVSPQVKEILGYPVENWYSHNFWPEHIHPEDRDFALRFCIENSKLKKDYDFEYRMISSQGESIWLHDIVSVMTRSDGGKFLSGYMLDITDRKKAEKALQLSKETAERANIAKSQFLANMSHEIRTPIGAILGFIEMLKINDKSPVETSNFISIIERNSKHLLRLIDGILDLSKIEAEKLEIESTSFSLLTFLHELHLSKRLLAAEKGLEFELKIDGRIPEFVRTDQMRLQQILANVVGNAIKFTKAGQVSVIVSFETPHLKFLVNDSGRGISDEQAKKLFQPFSQADPSMTRRYGGTGLGLILSKHLSKALGGDVILHSSEPGLGSSFLVTIKPEYFSAPSRLTLLDSTNSESSWENANEVNQLSGIKVLVTEDSPDNRTLLLTYLKGTGAEVITAENGADGFRKALFENPDIVLMDIQMPIMDGHEAIKRLRDRGFSKPIIALTAHAMRDEREKCFSSGCTEYLSKPIQRERLIRTISKYYATCDERMEHTT